MNHNRFRVRPWLALVILGLASAASANWKEKVLYSFQGLPDGSLPVGAVVFDKAGNLYGATTEGGSSSCRSVAQCGTVYKLVPPAKQGDPWTETVLHVFKGNTSNDGSTPAGGVILDKAGNLYGSTAYGGAGNCTLLGGNVGCGTVWKLTPPKQKGGKWTESVIYSFQGGKDGDFPNGDLTFDNAGNLYGATLFGGGKGTTCNILFGGQCGTVFKLSPPTQKGGKWTEKVLHSFAGGTDGATPNGGLLLDSKGNIYGTTPSGGNTGCQGSGCGMAFELKSPQKSGGAWAEKILHVFSGGNDGSGPNGNLIFEAKGALCGTAGGGGKKLSGIVFRLRREPTDHWGETVLHSFGDENAPCCPRAGLGGWPTFTLFAKVGTTKPAITSFPGGHLAFRQLIN